MKSIRKNINGILNKNQEIDNSENSLDNSTGGVLKRQREEINEKSKEIINSISYEGITYLDDDGKNNLMLAAERGEAATVKAYIDKGMDLNVKDKSGKTALALAAKNNNLSVINILTHEANCQIDITDNEGNTALIVALLNNNQLAAEQILTHKQKLGITNKNGQSALTIANKKNYSQIAALIQPTRSTTPIEKATNFAKERSTDAKVIVQEASSTVLETVRKGSDALERVFRANSRAVETVIQQQEENFAKLKEPTPTPNQISAQELRTQDLFLAARLGNAAIIEKLVKTNMNINEKDGNGKTALMLAAKAGHLEAAKLLMGRNSIIDKKDNDGKTAFDLALDQNHFDIAKELLFLRPNLSKESKIIIEESLSATEVQEEKKILLQKAMDKIKSSQKENIEKSLIEGLEGILATEEMTKERAKAIIGNKEKVAEPRKKQALQTLKKEKDALGAEIRKDRIRRIVSLKPYDLDNRTKLLAEKEELAKILKDYGMKEDRSIGNNMVNKIKKNISQIRGK
jgi:ankyrin repeat protein